MVFYFSFWEYDNRLKLLVHKWVAEIKIFRNEIRLWKKHFNFGVALSNSLNIKTVNRIK